MSRILIAPLTIKAANAYIEAHHRHHKRVQGHRFSLGASITGSLGDQVTVGVCVVGRPVARAVNQQFVAEVTRLCTQGHPHVCSKLYAAAARACKAMGFWRIQTYTLASEPGTSLVAAGWSKDGDVRGRGWSCESRPRRGDRHPHTDKIRWAKELNPQPEEGLPNDAPTRPTTEE